MLKVQEIRELIRLIDDSKINEFCYETNGTKVTMKKQGGQVVSHQVAEPVQTAAPASVEKQSPVEQAPEKTTEKPAPEENKEESSSAASSDYDSEVTSPMVGTFYAASSPESDPFVQVGDKVKPDSVVCIVEAMKLFNEIEAEVSGEIVEILVEDGELVEYGQPLFRVKKV
ncbi:acetyl-CoA carboxylase biotin carboxyl carrier protein [Thalassobacillus devorans]|uniref:acetyl-CoA carboxylase biotin carboxyl carrier protein n=1 Tax=Thalassobacillus devorans TaxID=279813 RepID=UPI00048C2FB7|nr:acetyl-CoA carboxylase biotin carboxyl carrier protein [Thalassobacillus devorans]